MPDRDRSRPPGALDTVDLTVHYGGVRANDRVSIGVHAGEVVGLIGPNGAGKTTFIDAVSGFARSSGAVTVAGRRVDSMPPHRRRASGLARTWQAGELFHDLTVAGNIAVACHGFGLKTMLGDLAAAHRDEHEADINAALAAVGLPDVADRCPMDLPLGAQKLVGVARALAGGSEVLLLDEPAAGLDAQASLRLGEQLRTIADGGAAVLLVDHDLGLVLEICHRIYVMDFGRIIAHGPPKDIAGNPNVVSAYLGTGHSFAESPAS